MSRRITVVWTAIGPSSRTSSKTGISLPSSLRRSMPCSSRSTPANRRTTRPLEQATCWRSSAAQFCSMSRSMRSRSAFLASDLNALLIAFDASEPADHAAVGTGNVLALQRRPVLLDEPVDALQVCLLGFHRTGQHDGVIGALDGFRRLAEVGESQLKIGRAHV